MSLRTPRCRRRWRHVTSTRNTARSATARPLMTTATGVIRSAKVHPKASNVWCDLTGRNAIPNTSSWSGPTRPGSGVRSPESCRISGPRTPDSGRFSLLRLLLHTGRQHQIRVHAAHNGCPLVGDWVYGEACHELAGQALHAALMEFAHPVEKRSVRIEAPFPRALAD